MPAELQKACLCRRLPQYDHHSVSLWSERWQDLVELLVRMLALEA